MKQGECVLKNMHIMSTNSAKTLVWKHEYDVQLWHHQQGTRIFVFAPASVGCANEIVVEQKSANRLSEGWKALTYSDSGLDLDNEEEPR